MSKIIGIDLGTTNSRLLLQIRKEQERRRQLWLLQKQGKGLSENRQSARQLQMQKKRFLP